jgi:integrase
MRAASSQFTPTGVSTLDRVATASALGPPQSRALTVARYASTWLESIEGLVSARTLEDYTGRLERHVLPRFGQRRLDEVGIDDILGLIADLQERGYAGSTICTVLNPLSRMFAHAARRQLIQVNPVSKLDRSERPRVSRRERPVLSRAEIRRLLAAAPPHHRTLLATAILSGLRQGELLGLHWRDVDFDNQVIRVRSALDRKQRDVPPKTQHALRDVVLMPALAQALQQHRAESRFSDPGDYVFTTRVGTPLHWANLGSKALNPALTRAGLRPLRWHDLRHTFASLLIAGGANITFVSRQLGHSSSQITLGVYAHLLDREEQAQHTRDMLEAMLGDAVRDGASTTIASVGGG